MRWGKGSQVLAKSGRSNKVSANNLDQSPTLTRKSTTSPGMSRKSHGRDLDPTTISSRMSHVFADKNNRSARPHGRHGWDRFVIHPDNRAKGLFDVFVVLCVIYTNISAPVKVVFKVSFLPWLDVLTEVIFWFDVLLQFCHGYYHNGFPVLSLRKVAKRYTCTWFTLDLVAALPFERLNENLGACYWASPASYAATHAEGRASERNRDQPAPPCIPCTRTTPGMLWAQAGCSSSRPCV